MKYLITILIVVIFWLFAWQTQAQEALQANPIADAIQSVPADWDMKAVVETLVNFYQREMQTSEGRRRWHGNCTKATDPQLGIEIEVYDDGEVFTNNLKKTSQQKVDDANRRLKFFTDAKGFPTKLREARKANAFAKTNTVEVTVELTAGK